jgi:hypothetical protein
VTTSRWNSLTCSAGYAEAGKSVTQWLPLGHKRGLAATLTEDLTVIAASSYPRRFLATPLDEIIA